MKKIISLVLALVMTLALCACGSRNTPAAAPETTPEPTAEPTPDVTAQADEAKALFQQGDYHEAYEALRLLDRDAVEGVSALLGVCQYYGLGTEVNAERAVSLLTDAAEEGTCTPTTCWPTPPITATAPGRIGTRP